MNGNPCGITIAPQAVKQFNRADCIAHVKAANYITVTVLDDFQLALDLHNEARVPYPVYRDSDFKPQPGDNPKAAALRAFIHIKDKVNSHPGGHNVLFMVNCEEGFSKAHCEMWAEMIRLSAVEPSGVIGLVVGNEGVGKIKSGQGDEPNQWETDGKPLLQMLDVYRAARLPSGAIAFHYGSHDYTGLFGWISSDGGEHRLKPAWKDRPLLLDWTKAQWHIGRYCQGINDACKTLKISRPSIIVTECLIDDLPDVAYTFGNAEAKIHNLKLAEGYEKPRGWRSLIPQWKIWFPEFHVEDGTFLAKMVQWAWEVVFAPLGNVIGLQVFIYCNTGDYESFRVDNASGYLKEMEGYRWMNAIPTIDPADSRFRQYRAFPKQAGVNTVVRSAPYSTSLRLDVIKQTGVALWHIPPDDLTVIEIEYQTPGGVLWDVLRLPDGRVGYAHSDYIRLLPVPEIPPQVPPIDPVPLPPAPPAYITVTQAEQMIKDAVADLRQSIYKEIHQSLLAAFSQKEST